MYNMVEELLMILTVRCSKLTVHSGLRNLFSKKSILSILLLPSLIIRFPTTLNT